jgi:hypothetical protein
MEELIGKSFKRNVYGPSIWTDTITKVWVVYSWTGKTNEEGRWLLVPHIMVQGTSIFHHKLEEILIVPEPQQLENKERAEKIKAKINARQDYLKNWTRES